MSVPSRDPAGALILAAMVTGAAGSFGGFLDTAWHRTIGRDSFFVLPHLFIYGAVVSITLVVLTAVIVASRAPAGVFAGPLVRLGRVSLPLGFAISGLGALTTVTSAAVDEWYHRAYGKDVLIWSPPHLMAHGGALLIAAGLLFAAAAQRERGWFRSRAFHRAVLLLLFLELTQRMLFLLAHYTMIPESRTPDYYPFLVAVLVVPLLIASARVLGSWAPILIGGLHLILIGSIDLLLWMIDFAPYTLTPLVVIPALGMAIVFSLAGTRREQMGVATLAGLAFILVFLVMESAWMAWIVSRPWPPRRVLMGLPKLAAATVASAWVGWALAEFLNAVGRSASVSATLGGSRRAWSLAGAALALTCALGIAVYSPTPYFPPAPPRDFGLVPIRELDYREAVFWEVLHGSARAPGVFRFRSESVVDGLLLPVGPAWCEENAAALDERVRQVRFGLTINGEPVDLSAFPAVRVRERGGALCQWVGVAASSPPPGHHRFVYTIESPAGHARVEMDVVLKLP